MHRSSISQCATTKNGDRKNIVLYHTREVLKYSHILPSFFFLSHNVGPWRYKSTRTSIKHLQNFKVVPDTMKTLFHLYMCSLLQKRTGSRKSWKNTAQYRGRKTTTVSTLHYKFVSLFTCGEVKKARQQQDGFFPFFFLKTSLSLTVRGSAATATLRRRPPPPLPRPRCQPRKSAGWTSWLLLLLLLLWRLSSSLLLLTC